MLFDFRDRCYEWAMEDAGTVWGWGTPGWSLTWTGRHRTQWAGATFPRRSCRGLSLDSGVLTDIYRWRCIKSLDRNWICVFRTRKILHKCILMFKATVSCVGKPYCCCRRLCWVHYLSEYKKLSALFSARSFSSLVFPIPKGKLGPQKEKRRDLRPERTNTFAVIMQRCFLWTLTSALSMRRSPMWAPKEQRRNFWKSDRAGQRTVGPLICWLPQWTADLRTRPAQGSDCSRALGAVCLSLRAKSMRTDVLRRLMNEFCKGPTVPPSFFSQLRTLYSIICCNKKPWSLFHSNVYLVSKSWWFDLKNNSQVHALLHLCL